ncbi:MAG: enoyl-CoA hydratase-related protein, partial [Halobacteria archaeon]|nr:enoyl-CoA hydratase-related protein [Halobacteria archaeon]
VPEHTVFATNTSSLSITELSEATDRPERFAGMHFFNPPVRMDLVEVIRGKHTNDETMDLIEDLAEDMDKTPVRVRKDSPGFIVNRVLVPLMNEAAWMVHDGDATIEEVDSTTKFGMGLPMGAFELADYTGLDIGYHVLEYMNDVLGEPYKPCPLWRDKVDADELGQKTGKGFYDYDEGEGAEIPTDKVREEVEVRLKALMANEVAKLIENDVAPADEIDRAMKIGTNFPEGPAKMADDMGLDRLHSTLEELYDDTGEERYKPADYLVELAEKGEGFYGSGEADEEGEAEFETLKIEKTDDMVGHIKINRPHRLNSINAELVDELDGAIDMLEDDDEVRAILLTGEGDRAFSAGADVQSLSSIASDPLTVIELSRKGQRVFGRLETVDMPVVAGIDGYCLGGGMELATCADLRVASKRSEMGQTEFNLGIMPGWGGTQRLQRIVGQGRAKEIIFTAERFDAETMYEYGFVNEVVENDEFDERAYELAADLAAGPPVAHKFTKRAMNKGWENIEAGFEIESEAFGHIFNTEDLMEGISAFMSDREPEFEGK